MKNNKKKKSCYDKNIMLLQGKYVITKEKSCYNEKRLCENIKLLHDNITLLQGKYVMWKYNMIRKKGHYYKKKLMLLYENITLWKKSCYYKKSH